MSDTDNRQTIKRGIEKQNKLDTEIKDILPVEASPEGATAALHGTFRQSSTDFLRNRSRHAECFTTEKNKRIYNSKCLPSKLSTSVTQDLNFEGVQLFKA